MFVAAPKNAVLVVVVLCTLLAGCVPPCTGQGSDSKEVKATTTKKATMLDGKKDVSLKKMQSAKEPASPTPPAGPTTVAPGVEVTAGVHASGADHANPTTMGPASTPSPAAAGTTPASREGPTISMGTEDHHGDAAKAGNDTEIARPETAFGPDSVTMPSEYSFPKGFTNLTDETHEYYNSTIITDRAQADALWIELDNIPETANHDMLSESYRRAATLNLSFPFPFYGHPINNVTIATGGFLYVGYALHLWLAATQFIAPLMANFKADANHSSAIKYYDNGTMFVVEWRNVKLEDKPEAGNFTFQTILHANGDIVFVYKEIPLSILDIAEKKHPVKVGISDAYLFKRTVFLLKRKTIYEYHSINKKSDLIRSHTAIVIKALPTCVSLKTCEECTTAQINFNCTWCDAVQRCSSGVDRHRQSWITNNCEDNSSAHKDQCRPVESHALSATGGGGGGGALSALLIVVSLVLVLAGWLVYAYRNPRSTSGQLLIKYRPSQWKRHGEARYIAAGSLHM